MSIHVASLSYAYGSQEVLSDISFDLPSRTVVGLLGPNGAGKSTLMRLLTGYLTTPKGRIRICGQESHPQSSQSIRQQIGYLPECNPLYEDMYTKELLRFSAKLYGLRGRSLTDRIEEMIQSCGLEEVRNKKISKLSKGYRQRLGLARALLHKPKVLILDEPSAGLDPNQIIALREMIRSLSSEMCILFSTHILQEVEAICEEVILLHKGRLIIQDSLSSFMKSYEDMNPLRVEFTEAIPHTRPLGEIKGIAQLEVLSAETYILHPIEGTNLREAVLRYSEEFGHPIRNISKAKPSLEDIFKQLTQESSPPHVDHS